MINETHKRILKMMGVTLTEQVNQENQPLTPLQKIESLLNDEGLTEKLSYLLESFNVETKEEFVAINEASVFDNKDYTKRRAKKDICKYKSCEVVRIYQP